MSLKDQMIKLIFTIWSPLSNDDDESSFFFDTCEQKKSSILKLIEYIL